jgi:thioredoxin 1
MMPILEELSETYKGKATIIRVNVDENPALQKAQKIDEIPYFKLYRNGQEAGNFIGQMDRSSFIRILDGK